MTAEPAASERLPLSALMTIPRDLASEPLNRADLGWSRDAWAALIRDGDLIEVRPEHAVLPGTRITPTIRVAALRRALPRGRATAAWVHTGVGSANRVHVLYSPGGYRPRQSREVATSQARVRGWEVTKIDGTALTSMVRTAMDVATWCPQRLADACLRALVAEGLQVDEALAGLDRIASWRGAERARDRLRAVQ